MSEVKKVIMLGNEAIARGAYEAGVKVSAAYPGTPSTEISENLVKYKDDLYCEWSPNEKVATEVAIGASVAGVRAMSCMKHVGFNVAADPAYTVSYMGVNGGLVIVVADDPGLYSSQNEQDTRMVARAAQLPVLEPSDSSEAKEFMKIAFDLSEKFDRPFVFRTTTRLAHSQGLVELCDREEIPDKPYEKNIRKTVMMPGNAKLRHVEIEKRNLELAEAANTLPINRVEMNDTKIGVITSGIPYQYVKEALPNASVLKLGMVNPLPRKLIEDFASKVEKLYIVEELDPVIEEQVKSWGIKATGKEIFTVQGEYSANMLREAILGEELKLDAPAAAPGRPPILCPGCPHRSVYYVLNKLKMHAAGDIGCYTLGNAMPLDMVDTCLCMGAGLNIAQGVEKVEPDTTCFAFVGDSTFFASAITGVVNAVYNQANMVLIVLDNSTTAMTGHQPHPGTGQTVMGEIVQKINIEQVLRGIGVTEIETINPLELEASVSCVKRMAEKSGVRAIIFKAPCIAVTKPKAPLHVNQDSCIGCKKCIRDLGCPAIVMNDGKICIDASMCTGCHLCSQVCPVCAIVGGDDYE